jgi:uncharacterized protein (DUF924 family)
MRAEELHEFWFKRDPRDWFAKNPDFDAEIRARFGALWEHAAAGGLDSWKNAARSCLALVILLDQFPRNMFRGSARAFASDRLALEAARHAVASGYDRSVPPEERTFFYLPFEHSESLADQLRSCELMGSLGPQAERWALAHRRIIERFGRFPHRNAILGRASTPEEVEFLEQPGSDF